MNTYRYSSVFSGFQYIENLECRFDEPLDLHTSMKMRSRAAVFLIPHTFQALEETLKLTRELDAPVYMLGGGSNSLFSVSYFEGIVIKLGAGFEGVRLLEPDIIRVGAGLDLKRALSFSMECGLSGLEFARGIPGTVGGAAAGNAGARDHRGIELGLCDRVERLVCFDKSGSFWKVERDEFFYTYRMSELREVVIAGVELRLEPKSAQAINDEIRFYNAKRKGQPYGLPSCGCVFKNPEDPNTRKPISAGKLIDDLGLKGYSIGGASISDRHANFMVNTKDRATAASGEDFQALINLTKDIVFHNTGIDLEVEVRIVGGQRAHVFL